MGQNKARRPPGKTDRPASAIGRHSACGGLDQTDLPETDQLAPANMTTSTAPAIAGFHSSASLVHYGAWLSALEGHANNAVLGAELLELLQRIRNKIIGNSNVKKILMVHGLVPK